ncbi:MAG: FtsX-like permease family protein [Candidatus Heimdallarchaeota archaeon]|nr:MAG: FtsX-like permease family protein [Candidatus Heimdallarchaeota archaeon]
MVKLEVRMPNMKFLTRIWFKKLVRDLARHKLLTFALILLCFFGTGSFLALSMGYENLYSSYKRIYRQTNFADAEFFTLSDNCFNTIELDDTLTNFTIRYEKEIQAINFRLITGTGYNVTSSIGGIERQFLAGGRAIGIEWPQQEENRINDLIFTSSSYSNCFSQENSVLLESHFAQKFDIERGDTLTTRIFNQTFDLIVQGVVFSPEYLVIIPSKHDFLPTSVFGIIYLPIERLQAYTNLTGLANNLLVKMSSGVNISTRNHIIEELAEVLDESAKGVFAPPVMQEDQISNMALRLDLETFEEVALTLPIVVLGVAAVSIYITLGRTVQSQRRNIGIASSLGYFPNDILFHFTCFSLLIGGIGSILGVGFGIIVSGVVTWVYSYFMRFPQIIEIQLQPHLIFIALVTSLGISLLSGAIPAWNASRMTPRKALQTMFVTEKGSYSIFEKILFVKSIGLRLAIPLRNLSRKKGHTIATMTAIAAAVMIIIVSFAFIDSVTAGVNRQFNETSQYDLIVKYEGLNYFDLGVKNDVTYIQSLPGVVAVEPVLQIPSSIKTGGRSQGVLITAWNNSNPTTHRFHWSSSQDTLLPNNSIVVCSALAHQFNIKVGNEIEYNLPFIKSYMEYAYDKAEEIWNETSFLHGIEFARNETLDYIKDLIKRNTESISFSKSVSEDIIITHESIRVSGISKEIWGSMVYTTLQTITSNLGIDMFKSGLDIDLTPTSQLILKVSQASNVTLLEEIKTSISQLEGIRSIEFSYDFHQAVDILMAAFNAVILVFLIFACLLAGAAIFTTIYLSFQERQREIATMLTLGLSDREFLSILTVENLSQGILGILLGIPPGLWIASWILDNVLRLFYFEIIILPTTWILIWVGVIGVILISQIPAYYYGVRLDLTVVTKELSS